MLIDENVLGAKKEEGEGVFKDFVVLEGYFSYS